MEEQGYDCLLESIQDCLGNKSKREGCSKADDNGDDVEDEESVSD